MEILFEIIFQFLGELILQILFEALGEAGLHGLVKSIKRPHGPIVSGIGFALWGAIFGAISLLVLPESPIRNPDLRLLNLLVTPVLAGMAMVGIGRLRQARGQDLVKLDRFFYAYLFALSFALVRFFVVA